MTAPDHHRACAITLGYNACTCPMTAPDPTDCPIHEEAN